jgi:hypothetical protein
VQDPWLRRVAVAFATGIATLAVGIPVGQAGNCVYGYCVVSLPGADGSPAAAHGTLDSYWRDGPIIVQPNVASPGEAPAARESNAFVWSDFGVGIGVAFGSMLVLAALATGVLGFRVSRDRTTGQAEPA